MPDAPEPTWEAWMDNPFQIDQTEGTVLEEPEVYQMQVKAPYGGWEPLSSLRTDRDEVTRLQAYYIRKDESDGQDGENVRVLKRKTVWTVEEVPGDGEGQTPTAHILARNDQITQGLIGEHTKESAQ